MGPLMVSALISMSVVSAQPQLKLAAPGLTGVEIPEKTAAFFNEHLAQELTREGARMVTAREISALLGLERQKQLLGCSEQATSCMVELANAIGVDGIVLGDVARIGNKYQVNLKILSATDATPVALHSARLESEEAVLDELSAAAKQLAPQAARTLRRDLTPAAVATNAPSNLRRWAWVPAVGGVVAGGVGAVAAFQTSHLYNQLTDPRSSFGLTDAQKVASRGMAWQTATYVGLGVGAAGLAAGAALWLFGGTSGPVPAVSIGPGGASVGLTWRLP